MNRRSLLASWPLLAAARSLLGAEGESRFGLATFACHQHWGAVRQKRPFVKFTDALSFYDYARKLGGDGVQTGLRGQSEDFARALRVHVETTGGYYEGDISLPMANKDTADFERDVKLARLAGATVARTTLTGTRRYEGFKSLSDFQAFERESELRVAKVEPILKKHGLKLAIENHKDHTAAELAAFLHKFNSEWIGATVDTGNNVALLEEPQSVIETLAPFAFTVHLKDMAVQPYADGFLLSEVNLGTGALDLSRMIKTLRAANPKIVFNLEMAMRDPLKVPCSTDAYWVAFDKRNDAAVTSALEFVARHPLEKTPPQISGKPQEAILAEEEANNTQCLAARKSLSI